MFDHEAYLEHELINAPRALSNHLFHYTNAEAAIFGILRSGLLRLSPFESTNDLWESRPLHPNLTLHHDDRDFGPDPGFGLWNELDRLIRLHAKVACLTQDWTLPDSVFNRDAFRGWNHLSIWAHYGGGHTGICLRFDRSKLIQSFATAPVPGALLRFQGPVEYRNVSTGAGPHGVDIGQIREFGLDAAAISYAEIHRDQIFFRKHADWSNESEYRLVLIDQSVLPVEVSIREALTGVFIGDGFAKRRLPALMAALKPYPDVEIFRLSCHNRNLACFPFQAEDAVPAQALPFSEAPRRSGSLDERLEALKVSVRSSAQQRARAAVQCAPLLQLLELEVGRTDVAARSWPKVEVAVHPGIDAVPDNLRSRAPGVSGEQIYFESGYICVVENLPTYTHTLVAATAVQVLDDDRVRIHAVVTTEWWKSGGNERVEHWRETCEAPVGDAITTIGSVLKKLDSALQATRSTFDRDRGL
ncbi:DUF2971 domain-containing protein [Micromonospora ureilytica]|uniref:DUF2971 domain-containing protein n=1 Tax=Micromonospora ureilytica TaxID=709868 RepID=UPI0033F34278